MKNTLEKNLNKYVQLFQDDFEDYSDDFEEETEDDNDKSENSDRESTVERNKKSKQNSDATRNSSISRIETFGKDALIDTTSNELYSNSPLLHRIMNRGKSIDTVQPSQVFSTLHR